MIVYVGLSVFAVIPIFLRVFIGKINNSHLSYEFHKDIVTSILKAPIAFLENIKKGEIINKISIFSRLRCI